MSVEYSSKNWVQKESSLGNISYKDLQATEYVYLYLKPKRPEKRGTSNHVPHNFMIMHLCMATDFMQISHCFDNSTGLILICKIPSNWCSAHPQRSVLYLISQVFRIILIPTNIHLVSIMLSKNSKLDQNILNKLYIWHTFPDFHFPGDIVSHALFY